MPSLSAGRAASLCLTLLGLGCADEPPRYPPPTYIDYTRQAPPSPTPAPAAPAPAAAAAEGPTIGDALAPFGIVLPGNISLLKLPPPSVWQNWPFTWPNLTIPPAPGSPSPAPATPAGTPNPSAPANPAKPPSVLQVPSGWSSFESEVLSETNLRRSSGTLCGSERLPPAPPLAPSLELGRAARAHSEDMAQNNYFDHTSLDGRSVEQRTGAAGFRGGFVGENIAAGRADAKSTVQQWIDSPGHCLNLMEPRYRFLGVGYARSATSRLTHFWTQNFGG